MAFQLSETMLPSTCLVLRGCPYEGSYSWKQIGRFKLDGPSEHWQLPVIVSFYLTSRRIIVIVGVDIMSIDLYSVIVETPFGIAITQ